MADWIRHYNFNTIVVATKIDKLKKSQIDKNLTEIYNDLQMDNNSILIPFSAEKRTGRNDLIALFDEIAFKLFYIRKINGDEIMKFARILYNDEIYYAKYDSSSNMFELIEGDIFDFFS